MTARSLQPFLKALEALRLARNMTLSEAIVFAAAADGSGRITLEELADASALSVEETDRILADFSEHEPDSAPRAGLLTKAARLPAGGPQVLSLTDKGEALYKEIVAALIGSPPREGPTER